jgi:hypothetical protein
MQDTLLITFKIMLQSLGITFIAMIVFYALIKVLVTCFPEDN